MDLTTIFCKIDDFCTAKNFSNGKFLTDARKRNRKFRLCPSEIATIVVYFHLSNYRNFKHFYFQKILGKQEFPNAVSYNRYEFVFTKKSFVCTNVCKNGCKNRP
jgi:hypothetical protein